ncbi:exostosin domain-containing protein [Rhodobacter maris]|uniref:Exostosin family protein n=1 Tax=Rhodobacter maris TaxID=446682 RepID=A0A285SGH7_9RHOB|nr:exostosin family protein [Rhodobacter maris]SOC06871.1 exostosin family protein [Rhodobacter maris]
MSKTIFITTPCLNMAKTIDRTIQSVVSQAGDFFIRYHIQDGGSDDGTLDRLGWWQRHIGSPEFVKHCLGIEFSYLSEPDTGMYDALCKGFANMEIPPDAFMTWINGDDLLTQGSCAFIDNLAAQFNKEQVSWVGGATSVFRGNRPMVLFDNPIPRDALRLGLCEGQHWNFLQQEGTYFRKWLWSAVTPEKSIAPMRLAGDWNLWRLFSAKAALVQTKVALATFRITDDQLSSRQREKYIAEIDAIVPEAKRRAGLERLTKQADLSRRTLKVTYADAGLTVQDEGCNGQLKVNAEKIFGKDKSAAIPGNGGKVSIVFQGVAPEAEVSPSDYITLRDNIFAHDRDWQFPAITEQRAFHQLRACNCVPEGVTYVAYPWANLIDKLQTKSSDAHIYLAKFHDFCEMLPKDTTRVTVCQHIKMKEFLDLFETAGIAHVFWSHATHDDLASSEMLSDRATLSIHPFPLFPVQIPDLSEQMEIAQRPFLFSFIGARSNQYYLTQARTHILEQLHNHPRGLIIGRDTWHYNKVVYELQIRPGATTTAAEDLVNKSHSDQFRISLAQSVFSLCPSGSGPNSIRLWESLGAGAIPVILADTYAPPGDPALWKAAAVFCAETREAIAALPARLEEIAADPERLRAMRHAGAQLWLLYGPHSFVYDVQKLMLELGQGRESGAPPLPADAGDRIAPVAPRQMSGALCDLLVERLQRKSAMSREEAQGLLRACSGELLVAGTAQLARFSDATSPLGQMLGRARQVLPPGDAVLVHFREVLAHVQCAAMAPGAVSATSTLPALSSPALAPAAGPAPGPNICFIGEHSHRTPLSYPAFQAAARERMSVVADPARADVIMTGFNIDLRNDAARFEAIAKRNPAAKIMVISEEPLWDSSWSGGFTDTKRKTVCGETELAYTFLNHSNSRIFEFERIPYFLLTSDDLLTRFTTLIARNLRFTARDLLSRWQNAPIPAAFVAEKREGEKYALAFPAQEVWGLSSFRSEVAAHLADLPGVHIEGKGWVNAARRQDLPDWHLDKLARLDGRVRVMSSYENTHQKHYISEKIFDAFVIGGVPTYYASPSHSIHRLVPEACMINSFGLSAPKAAARVRTFEPDLLCAEAWLDAARQLQARCGDTRAIRAERRRITDAVLEAIAAL